MNFVSMKETKDLFKLKKQTYIIFKLLRKKIQKEKVKTITRRTDSVRILTLGSNIENPT